MDDSRHSALPFFRRSVPEILTPAVLARKKRSRRNIAIIAACFALVCATQVMVGIDWSQPPPQNASNQSTRSASWEIGYADGRAAGQADAQRRHARKGSGATLQEAPRRTPPRRGFGADRRDYKEGWNVGYSVGREAASG